ncbi:MAG: hypothetical protein C0415_04950 [Thermodesulfovibrio sp.]|nr:hypothetical protein [Thermodesulfovibrio sp.]
MQGLVVLIIVILVIVLVLQILGFILQITFASLPAWGVAVPLILLSQYLFRAHRVEKLNSYETLSKMMIVRVDENSNKLNWSLGESQVEPYINNNAAISVFLSIVIGVVSLVIILPILYQNGAFKGLQFFDDKISSQTGLIWGYILSGIIIMITLGISKPKKSFEKSLKERANYLTNKVNTQLERIDELRSLESSIKSIASKLKASFPTDYQTEIQKYIDANKVKILLDSAVLNNLIARNIKQAQEDKSHLEKTLKLYNTAEGFYKEVSYKVIMTGSMPFVTILEDIYGRLNSENLKSLLSMRKWKEYVDVVNTIIEVLKDLHEQSAQYQGEGREKETATYTEETDKEKACKILNIPITATNDHIKRAWKALSFIWHPDGKQLDDTKFKEISWAYDVLKRERNIT